MATGKISRLPREIREQLNRRLDGGEPGKRLVAWLNDLPEVKALLAAEFGGAGVINAQNLTNWKQGGFRDWRMEQEAAAWSGRLTGQKDGAEQQLRPTPVTTEQLVTVVAVRHMLLIREWMQSPMPVERRWRQMRVILRDTLKLQRQGQLAERLSLDWERLQFAMERFEEEKLADKRWTAVAFLAACGRYKRGKEAISEGIKVNQGEKNLKNEEELTKLVACSPSWRGSQPQSACDAGKVCRRATDSTSHGWRSDPVHLEGQRGLWESMGHNGSYSLLNMSRTIRLRCATARQGTRRRTRTICLRRESGAAVIGQNRCGDGAGGAHLTLTRLLGADTLHGSL